MKLTPELITHSPSSINALKDRELDLRGHKIPAIENLGVTKDLNDAIDLTDNDIRALSNFPLLKRLHTLNVSNNLVSRIDPRLAHALPSLTSLILTNNSLAELSELQALRKFPRLEFLSLMGNPVARHKHYREYVIWACPKVRVLDFRRIRDKERTLAKQLLETSDGRPSALAASLSQRSSLTGAAASDAKAVDGARTFEPGQTPGAAGRLMSAEERKALEAAIERSSSLEEIRRLEERLRLGYAVEEPAQAKGGKKGMNAKGGKKGDAAVEEEEEDEEMDE